MRSSCWPLILVCAVAGCGSDPVPEEVAAVQPGAPTSPAEAAGDARAGAPVIEAATLSASRVKGGEPISVRVDVFDPDGDPVDLSFDWYVNRQLYRQGQEPSLDTSGLRRDSEVYALVHASDGQHETLHQTATVRVENSPPVVTRVTLSPEAPTAREPLTAVAEVRDREGDSYDLIFEWRVNGRPVEGITEGALPAGKAKRGDQVSVRVWAKDQDQGPPFDSEPVRLANAKPLITSEPAVTLASATGYRYEIKAEDPDGDRPLRYSLVKGPPGMTVDLIDGTVEWDVPPDADGKFSIEVAVQDRFGGTAQQAYVLEFHWEKVPAKAEAPASQDEE